MKRRSLPAAALVAAVLLASKLGAQELTPLPAVVHIHSDLSTGPYTSTS